ncbi:lycopene cyclase domain-containing protein [Pontimicrobium sp. SW4]|uniref:Lycopene cyclase domain-containing protein n=1 Tax=Pontimicrobium sp. SW4 TaxID=3153519 RepID=A0AAU7BPV6_9FLAO
MNYLYLLLNLGSLSIPLIFSFHPKFQFYKYWKSLFLAIVITMCIFIPWDVIFTNNGFWGFNDTYFLGTKILGLPIEEWLFFICIPYACVFTHYALLYYFPNTKISIKNVKQICYFLITILILVTTFNYDKWYTLVNFTYAILLIIIVLKIKIVLLQTYFITFLIMLIPFFIVNGLLTGSFIENEVVWYNNQENLGIRLFTIPIEDSIYAFTLILTNLVLIDFFQTRLFRKENI